MARILHIVGSPRPNSVSTQLARTFLETYGAAHPADVVDVLDVWSEDLPVFGGEAADGKLKAMAGEPLPAAEQAAFDPALAYSERLKAADKVVLSSGMWNFTVPYRLKHLIDLIVQAGHTFDPSRGHFGLLTNRPLQLLLATGGDFSHAPMAEADMLEPYLRQVFGFIGFSDIRAVTAGRTAFPPEISGPALERSLVLARVAATVF